MHTRLMRHRRVIFAAEVVAAVVLLLGLAPGTPEPVSPRLLSSGTAMFLQIEGIEGEAMAAGMAGVIAVQSFQWGASHQAAPAGATGMGAGRAVAQPVVVTKTVDKSSPKLLETLATGRHLKEARLLLVNAALRDAKPYLTYTLTDVVITSCNINHTGGGLLPTESVSFNFTKITMRYMDGAGTAHEYTWDLLR